MLNFAPRGKLWPMGEVVPQEWILSPDGGEIISWGWTSLFAPPFF
jgi:hypothetical protein